MYMSIMHKEEGKKHEQGESKSLEKREKRMEKGCMYKEKGKSMSKPYKSYKTK